MNIRRGLFRLWLVLTVAYVLIAGLLMFDWIKSEFDKKTDLVTETEGYELLVPILCGEARGVARTDYSFKESTPRDLLSKPNPFDTCWYRLSRFRSLFPEYADLSQEALAEKLYTKMGIPRVAPIRPWHAVVRAVWIATLPPLGLLIIGSALAWAFSGFKRKSV